MIGRDLNKAAKLLNEGKVIGIPTETVYGLAGNALNLEAITSIFKVKNRPFFDPLIVHISDLSEAEEYTTGIPEPLLLLAEAFMPGPLTLLLERRPVIPDLITSGLPRVAIRVPIHPVTKALLSILDFPLAAPSANPFGYISPTTAQHVADQLGDQLPYILDGGACQVGIESTIVGMEEDRVVVYRKGGISIEALQSFVPNIEVKLHSQSDPMAPGMLQSHYAPSCPLIIVDEFDIREYPDKKVGVISFNRKVTGVPEAMQYILSPNADFGEAAQRLFGAMRHLDTMDLDLILVKLLPEKELGRAINDRLRRAASR